MNNLIINNEASPKKILIADDDSSALSAISCLLRPLASIIAVNSGNKAIELLKQQHFDVVVADYQMPDGNGMKIIRFLQEYSPETPIILITSHANKSLLIESLNMNISGFIEKPYLGKEVLTKVSEVLNKREIQEENKKLALLGKETSKLIHDTEVPANLNELKRSSSTDPKLNETINKAIDNSNVIHKIKAFANDQAMNEKITKAKVQSFKLEGLFNNLKKTCAINAIDSRVHVVLHSDKEVMIQGNPEELLGVFVKLVNNAINEVQNLDERWVLITAQKRGQSLKICITDSSKTIDQGICHKILNYLFASKKSVLIPGFKTVLDTIKHHGGIIYRNNKSENSELVIQLPTYK